MNRLYQCAAIAALLAGVAPLAAQAQQTVPLGNSGLYVGVDVGAIVPQSVHLSVNGSAFGETVAASGNLHFDTGVASGVVVGYHVMPTLAVEGNFEYAGFDIHSVSGTIALTGPVAGTVSGTIGLQGRVNSYNGLVNAIWTPLGPDARYGIAPYIGAGIGFSHVNETLTAATIAGTTITGNVGDDQTDFAANAIVGADFPLPMMPQLTLGVRYRLLFVNSSSSSTGPLSVGNFFGHVFTANATWHF